MAQQQALWPQAEVYATKALQIYIDANDLHRQGNMYGQLGIIARAQHQWSQARDYFLRALKSFVAQGDTHSASITLGDLAWHWSEHNDETLPPSIASILGASVEEVEERLRKSKANIQP
jgi:tetratricopeptide (TPR) repeat protein